MIRIISVGAVKEDYIRKAMEQQLEKLRARTEIQLLTVEDEKCPENLSEKEKEGVKRREGQKILRLIRPEEKVVALTLEGKAFRQREWEGLLREGEVCFLIGGSLGLSEEVKKRANAELSFGSMTYPHQLMRWILLEQIALAEFY